MKPMKPAILVAIGLVFGAIVGVLLVAFPTLPVAASDQAEHTDWLYKYMLGISGVIFGLVTVVLVYTVYAFRARRGQTGDGDPIHGVTWLEIVWTAIPAVIVISIVALSWRALDENEQALALPREQTLNIHVTGFRFNWEYDYLDAATKLDNSSELVVPVGKPIYFTLETKDVIHSFWVPAWRLQMNTTPGQVNHLTVTPTKTGTFDIVCAFLCGPGHADMNSAVGDTPSVKPVRVVTEAEFTTWMTEQQAKAAEQAASAPPGASVFSEAGCGGCHALASAGANGNVGPALDDLTAAAEEAGQPLADFVRSSIVDPNGYVAPGYGGGLMPGDYGDKLSPEQVDQLVALLSGGGA